MGGSGRPVVKEDAKPESVEERAKRRLEELDKEIVETDRRLSEINRTRAMLEKVVYIKEGERKALRELLGLDEQGKADKSDADEAVPVPQRSKA